ncbi:non-functional NADPH-dependent codeinone reductase 2-like [Euphorbia lathyris]|uniref:non-functional NADPH-dependent codeinone reductase 2-like n=1 Tax=Euphorbia lathyris TaxID=212925 RepID=UPI0033143687
MESNSLIEIPQVVLRSTGCRMPVFGMGTAASPRVPSEQTKAAIIEAIKIGYRHFDTASFYLTEEPLGEAIAEALSLGLIQSRDDLFITTKLWCPDAHPHLVLPSLHKSLKALHLDYVDLYLIHWPVSSTPGIYEFPIKEQHFLPMDFKGVWEAMENCQKLGLAKSIGVSNFSCKKLSDILAIAEIPPAVNQVEINPLWRQKKLIEFCKENGIILTAYAPLGANGTAWGSNRVLTNEVLKEIAISKGKSLPQICLRWGYEQGICVLVKSFNKERMKQNIDIFNWTLSDEEHEKINEIPQSRGSPGEKFISNNGPIKTLEELWDGEI